MIKLLIEQMKIIEGIKNREIKNNLTVNVFNLLFSHLRGSIYNKKAMAEVLGDEYGSYVSNSCFDLFELVDNKRKIEFILISVTSNKKPLSLNCVMHFISSAKRFQKECQTPFKKIILISMSGLTAAAKELATESNISFITGEDIRGQKFKDNCTAFASYIRSR